MYVLYTPPFEGRVEDSLQQACSTFNVVRAASSRFDPYAGSTEWNTQNEWLSMRTILPLYFSVNSMQQKRTGDNRKNLQNKMSFTT
jgi:hypothetical protein